MRAEMGDTIEPGSSVSHYRIISAIGAGGMGQVYQAHDLTLERTVALKVLPAALVGSDEAVRRFVQEAKSASSLNHPNIITVHEIGQSSISSLDGNEATDAPPIHYIAMELIDGVTLKRRIHDGVTDLRTLLGYLAQAAEGLAKAHAAGIVHRDLKPDNVMVTRDGFTKVLDFGLAKLSMKKSAPDGNTTTEVRDLTREGTILGTLAYMSPEQLRGEAVDHRTDIFSFGCMLYEAATRRRPFEADSEFGVMHKIMHDKPVPVDELNPNAPAELRRMIRRCLAKDTERRYQSMKDVAIELADIVEEFDELSASTVSRRSDSIAQPLTVAPRRRITPLAVIATVAVLALAFVGIQQWRRHAADANRVSIAYGSMKIEQLTSSNNARRAAVSPDGKYVALVVDQKGQFSLSVLQVATKATVQVVPPVRTPLSGITFSPDSNYLFYNSAELVSGRGYSSMFQVPSLGGTPRRMVFDVDTAATFSPDGRQVAFGRGHPQTGENWLLVANADGTGERKLTSYKRIVGPPDLSWSPDGTTIVLPIVQVVGGLREELTAVNVATGAQRGIGKKRWASISGAAWVPDGKALVLTAQTDAAARSQVWLQPYPNGDPVRITNDLNQYRGVSVTSDGATIITIRAERDVDLATLKPGDGAATLLIPHSSYEYESVSAARGGLIAVTAIHEHGTDVALIDPGTDKPRLLTHDGKSTAPAVSADGKTIVFDSTRIGDVPHIFVADSDGGAARQLTNGSAETSPSLSADGRIVTYASVDGALWRINTAEESPPVRIVEPRGRTRYDAAPISHDGKMFLYGLWRQAGVRAELRLIIAAVESGKTIHDIPWNGQEVKWNLSDDALLFLQSFGGVNNLYTVPVAGGKTNALTNFTEGTILDFDAGPDGKIVLVKAKVRDNVVTIREFR
jgi:serine/threonine protein kinase